MEHSMREALCLESAVFGVSLNMPKEIWFKSIDEYDEYFEHHIATVQVTKESRELASMVLYGYGLPWYWSLILWWFFLATRALIVTWLPPRLRKDLGLPDPNTGLRTKWETRHSPLTLVDIGQRGATDSFSRASTACGSFGTVDHMQGWPCKDTAETERINLPSPSVHASTMPPSIVRRLYPRACENRLPLSHPEVKVNRFKFFKAASLNFVLLVLLFFSLFCYLFGSLFQQESRVHSLHILWVDYDGGIIGDTVRDAYKSLQSDGFPTLIERPTSEFPSQSDLREAVCRTNYWAALYTSPGSSASLGLAISGSGASQYNPSNILSYIWNEARYPTTMDSLISSNLHTLSDRARVVYTARNGTWAISAIPPNSSGAISAFTNPWTLSSINIQPTTQGTRTVYNTIVIVLVLIQDFFYLGAINGLYVQFKIYSRVPPTIIIVVRDLISGTFTMVGSLLISAAIWAFKAHWHVSGTQFALNWLILWLFAHVNFLTFDVFTIWLPPQYISMALVAWIVMNVTSIITPFELSSPFYRWAYALPAHAAYEALTDNWSSGCSPHLSYALPVLFAYELSGLFWTALGVYKRCHYAVITEETAQEAMRMRVEAALKLEREHDRRFEQGHGEKSGRRDENGESSGTGKDAGGLDKETPTKKEEEEDRREAERDFEELGREIERMETRATQMANFGPSFHLVGTEG
ncbi:hypothetical protein PT974_03495 [Cladobotryum mycophilum]|uniref:DUF3533 domain-containing protein n=1 Tax=Cladobotryum mycophilum TaxID=491253 RepID=A0ABR0STJ5_9HYPO